LKISCTSSPVATPGLIEWPIGKVLVSCYFDAAKVINYPS
jgi:hypothetical protein